MARIAPILLCSAFFLMVTIQGCSAAPGKEKSWSLFGRSSSKSKGNPETSTVPATTATLAPAEPQPPRPYHDTPQGQHYEPYREPNIRYDYNVVDGFNDAAAAVGGLPQSEESKYARSGYGELVLRDQSTVHDYRNWRNPQIPMD